jgi:hypothetical protein
MVRIVSNTSSNSSWPLSAGSIITVLKPLPLGPVIQLVLSPKSHDNKVPAENLTLLYNLTLKLLNNS